MSDNPYSILNVSEMDSMETIKKSYRKLSLLYHPDKNSHPDSTSKFRQISDAYRMIVNKTEFTDSNNKMVVAPPIIERDNDLDIYCDLDVNMEQAMNGIVAPMVIRREIRQGLRTTIENQTIYVDVPRGVDNDEIIVCSGLGNVIMKTANHSDDIIGDIKVRIHLHNDTIFIRKGLDLIYKRNITLTDALSGVNFSIQHIDGRELRIKTKENITIKSNMSHRMKKYGMTRGEYIGDLIIEFIVVFPENIPKNALFELNELFKKHNIN